MVPLKSGTYDLDPDTVEAQFIVRSERNRRPRDPFEAFFNGPGYKVLRRSLATESAKIEVFPIPDVGRPGDYQGLVGNFRLHSHLSTKELKEGENHNTYHNHSWFWFARWCQSSRFKTSCFGQSLC